MLHLVFSTSNIYVFFLSDPPKYTSISAIPSSPVLEGNPVTLICSSDANPALINHTWYKEIEGQLEQLQTGDNLTFSVTNTTHTGWYYCVAQNKHGQQNSSFFLDIQCECKGSHVTCSFQRNGMESLILFLKGIHKCYFFCASCCASRFFLFWLNVIVLLLPCLWKKKQQVLPKSIYYCFFRRSP